MKAIRITQPGGPEVLHEVDVATPAAGAGEILVKVAAVGLNRADLLQRMGRYPAPADVPQDIPGLEYAGTVEQTGAGVSNFTVGDRVFGIVGGGAYAEYLVVHARLASRIPSELSLTHAAAIPEAFMTAHDAMLHQAGLRPGESVLIHAVGSGVGLAAVQLARAMGATTFGSSRTADKLDRAKELGLDTGVMAEGFDRTVLEKTHGRGVDVVIDFVGGPYLAQNLNVLALCGRLMCVGTLGGSQGTVEMSTLLRKRLTVRGTVLRSRSLEEKAMATRAFEREVLPLLEQGRLRACVDAVMPMREVRQAHERMAGNESFGKIVLEW